MTNTTDAWEQALGSRSGPSPRPAELPRAAEASRHRAAEPHCSSSKTPSNKRLDIQGLRMIAVVAVVINHLTGHPKGGFVGVDVFFVISGYLITGLLVRDVGRDVGPVRYIVDFYKRRVRRLFPAALLTIVITILAAQAAFNSARFDSTRTDGLWAAVFWANWHFIDVGTNYFTANGPESPFQHYWSLSVEEQFYIVWPVALFLLAVILRARASLNARRAIGAVAAVIVSGVSLWWAFDQSNSNATSAYFSTFTRGWELGLGALLACVVPQLRASAVPLTIMSWVGTIAIIVSLFVVSGTSDFPAPGALLPCLGSALVIAAVSNDGARAKNGILTNRVSTFVGDISYSVYLVHFPVIILLAAYMPRGSYYYSAAVLLMAGISIAMYGVVEKPILNSGWLRPKGAPEQAAAGDDPLNVRYAALFAAILAVVGLVAVTLRPDDSASQNQKFAAINDTPAPTTSTAAYSIDPAGGLNADEQKLATSIQAALKATSYPKDLTPSIASALGNPLKNCLTGDCRENTAASRTMYIVGDSIGTRVRQVARVSYHDSFDVVDGSLAGCPVIPLNVSFPTSNQKAACLAHRTEVVSTIKRTKPEVVLISNDYGDASRISADDKVSAWTAALTTFLGEIKASTKHAIVVAPSPQVTSLATCASAASSSPIDCVAQPSSQWFDLFGAEQKVTTTAGAGYVNTFRWFCAANLYCPPFVDTTLVRVDGVHPTNDYEFKLKPVFIDALTKLGV